MWYFSWILGVLFACSVGIINAMWVEMRLTRQERWADPDRMDDTPRPGD